MAGMGPGGGNTGGGQGGNPHQQAMMAQQQQSAAMQQQPVAQQAPAAEESKDLSSNFVMAQINQCFKSDRIFHGVVSSKAEFRNLLGLIGKVPFKNRGMIARNLGAVIDINARLLQDTKVFESINTIMRNIPNSDKYFQETAGKIMVKLRDALIKNRNALDLYNSVMMEYSEVIRKFLAMVSSKAKSDFFSSLDEQILNFVLGKITKEDKEKHAAKNPDAAKMFADDDDNGLEMNGDRMEQLVKMLFNDVMRLEPELVSAVILSLVTQLPHGNMVIEDKSLAKDWMKSLA
ncbi:MAG: hypothetical protein AAF621_06200 [Pseudomonadota bacterium]